MEGSTAKDPPRNRRETDSLDLTQDYYVLHKEDNRKEKQVPETLKWPI